MTQETRLRIAMENLVDTMIDRNKQRETSIKNFRDANFKLNEIRALVMNENMMYLEDLNRAINFTLSVINTIMKEEK